MTTAATLWIATVIGLCFGGGPIGLAAISTRISGFMSTAASARSLRSPRRTRIAWFDRGRAPLELVAPTNINIVCYRYRPAGADGAVLKTVNTEIMLRMQVAGVAAVSDTTVRGEHCLRAAINNHRTRRTIWNFSFERPSASATRLRGKGAGR